MLIISKFHDYYDTAIAFGVDKTIVYDRKREEIGQPNVLRYHRGYREYEISNKNNIYTYQRHIIGFVGEIHPVLEITKYKKQYNWKSDELETKFFYSEEELNDYFDSEEVENTIEWWGGFGRSWRNKMKTDEFFTGNDWVKYKDTFTDHKVPVFLLSDEQLILNPILKDYKFAKIKDPFTAFQDIMQYISGVLGVGEPNTVEIGNEDMRDKKGFDDWSFKRHPNDSKKPRGKSK